MDVTAPVPDERRHAGGRKIIKTVVWADYITIHSDIIPEFWFLYLFFNDLKPYF
ncbi:hypothetical protein [Azorhizobium oxalatiphilum]|uniref:hypothetical protein n=1 Tax=Azorhizobium oxalatiphilum TaxID=980631 RepID=UPI0016694E8D|nr:hypothetical protein [Azorhizobium oxalatiphilum]